ncbi:ABC transporter ATP-binding protein [Actinomadura darangshiensis]|uniref:ABC transporter ATP-binding protein n=1 Tax=Actinomadura darangshiensis TaxID=705336 RepID=A0A4R4ZSU3_9ACTN|nr:ABC transporter ATP-binding protein [Actinomadura darangshiensis]TDD62113.1 ABC transporter ATP-binding protein [Actinomadura darangshiensis]
MDDAAPVTAAEWSEPPQPGLRRLPGLLWAAVRLAASAAPREFALITGLQAAAGLGLVLPVLGGRQLLDRALGGAAPAAVLAQGALVLGLTGLIAVAVSVASARDDVLSELLNRYAMGRILDAACAADLEEFERPAFHNRLERASMSARIRPHQIVQGLGALTSALMATAGVALALAAIEPLLVPATLAAGAPLWLAGLKSGQVLYGVLFRLTPAERERSYLQDVLTSRRSAAEVRAFGLAPYLRGRWEARTGERLGEIRRTVRRRLRITLLARLVSGLAIGAVLGPLLAYAATGRMPAADAGAAATAALLLAARLRMAAAGTDRLFEAAPFVQDLQTFLVPPDREAAEPPPPPFRVLTAENLAFTYPSADRPAVDGVDLSIEAGQVVALVGENGSGKTTLAKLLSHLYRPGGGRILHDGVDAAACDPDALRESIAVLFQDFERYVLPASDNVALGRAGRAGDEEAVRQAARAAGADAFLSNLPEGYATLLGPEFAGGADLSGGQWQRVALARAFFRDASFVILDEPTATLDARAEHDLFDRLRTLLAGRTVLLISHRFSTVRMADRIYVLADGRVAEHGTHDSLMAAGGRYAELFTLQAEGYLGPAGMPGR